MKASPQSIISKYRKKPVVIEAIIWDGTDECWTVIAQWLGGDYGVEVERNMHKKNTVCIKTLEGFMDANIGDYIIKGVKDEFYPCKPDIFSATYDEVAA
jgi:hypothetical protein